MGGLTGAVHWWEESQLRVLVLTSLLIQFFFVFFPFLRRRVIPSWFRFIMWLAYHGGDAVAIYALATLFNRHKDPGDGGVGGEGSSNGTLLEVVWAPVLLIHLGGQDGVTAYNIEDNELWTRHLLTAVSQVTVAVYVFCKSWPRGGDKKLLASAILLFVVGFVKCLGKARAFKMASIYSLASLGASAKEMNDGNMCDTLEEYVKHARVTVEQQQPEEEDHHHHQVVEEDEDPGTAAMAASQAHAQALSPVEVIKKRALACLRGLLSSSKDEAAEEGSSNHLPSRLRGERAEAWKIRRQGKQKLYEEQRQEKRQQERQRLFEERGEASKLFVDLSSSYTGRISIFNKFWGLSEGRAYNSVQGGLASAFILLYTKLKNAFPKHTYKHTGNESGSWEEFIRVCIYVPRAFLPWASIALFHNSHREAYNGIDVKVTYALLCCTAVLEFISFNSLDDAMMDTNRTRNEPSPEVWPETVFQYSVVGYFVRNKKHSIKMRVVSLLQCKDFLDQLWCMEPCFTSARITRLVLRYLEDGWKHKIEDAASYRRFNDHNHWELNMNRPFDECVLLWHLATGFCFFSSSSLPDHECAFAEPETRTPRWWMRLLRLLLPTVCQKRRKSRPECSQESAKCKAVQCRQMSNYMVYLLFVNPEMLLPGSRRNLFKTAYRELKDILKDCNWSPVCWSRCMPCGLGVKQMKEEAIVMEKLIHVMKENPEKRASQDESSRGIVTDTVITVTEEESERSSEEGSSMKGSSKEENFINRAWDLAKLLEKEKDEVKRWEEIQNVWVQMLCFSASRCRGYLHAKALGKGGEFLSYVWLLLFYMGMETFSERLQRELLPNELSQSPTIFGGLHQRRHSTTSF